MNRASLAQIQEKLERTTRRWWFIPFFVVVQFLIPPYTSKGFDLSKWGEIIGHILSNSLMLSCRRIYPLFQIIPIVLVGLLIVFQNRVVRLFDLYVAVSYVLFAVLQNISFTEKHGVGIVIVNVVMFFIVAAFWFLEAASPKNDFTLRQPALWRYWVVPPAVLAFWYPINWATLRPDFSPVRFLTSGSGLGFCMMTPVYVALLSIYHPRVNLAALRMTSLVGLIIGFYNMLVNFVMAPKLWWNGVLHLPLVILSIYGLILSFSRGAPGEAADQDVGISKA